MRLAPLSLIALVFALCWPVTASAYCPSTDMMVTQAQIDEMQCPSGLQVWWDDLTIHYAFNPERGSKDLSQADVREVFAQAFATWRAASCDDGSPGFDFIEDPEPSDEVDPSHTLGQKNFNTMSFRPADEWLVKDNYPPEAFALTTIHYEIHSGQLYGADMELNEGMGPWVRCPDSGCPPNVTDLANVVTHEAGHVIGLGESYNDEATMRWWGNKGDIDKRDLAQDDLTGLCEMYSPEAQLERERAMHKKPGGRCDISRTGSPAMLVFWILAVGVLWRRRTRGEAA
jgi:hypothetical protein